MTTLTQKDLIPPDRERCQAMIPNGYSFMTLGGVPGLERCSSKPDCIAEEIKPGADGLIGSMSLCGRCFIQFVHQHDVNEYKITAF